MFGIFKLILVFRRRVLDSEFSSESEIVSHVFSKGNKFAFRLTQRREWICGERDYFPV